jgi:hypothetical protein
VFIFHNYLKLKLASQEFLKELLFRISARAEELTAFGKVYIRDINDFEYVCI